ncbi:MAG: hypothetical protein AAB308_02320 [Nitrospirota bacterium]
MVEIDFLLSKQTAYQTASIDSRETMRPGHQAPHGTQEVMQSLTSLGKTIQALGGA